MTICAIILAATLPVFDFATNSIAERIAGADPAVCLSRFADYPPRGKWRTNEKFWLRDVDFSCVSPWNDSCGALRAGTLISRRHVIMAKHFPLWKGVRILFVDRQGEVCPCRIKATKSFDGSDILIGLLDYEVTPNIHPAKILPENYEKYIGNGKGLPVITFNQCEQTFLTEISSITTNHLTSIGSTNPKCEALGGKIVSGDSGNPAFLLVGNEPVLLYCLHSGGTGHGPSLFHRRHKIQRAMDDLCPGYKLQVFDFKTVTREQVIDERR